MVRGINAVWGKIPNVIEQRLLVALYEAQQPMTHPDILVLAEKLNLMNVSMNLLGLREKGLVTTTPGNRHALTSAGQALTQVGLEHNLFATPHELQNPAANLVTRIKPPPAPARKTQADVVNKPPSATRQELLRDAMREQDPKPPKDHPAVPPASAPPRRVSNGTVTPLLPLRAVATISPPTPAAAPKQAPAPSVPPPPAAVLTTAPPVIQQPKPKSVTKASPPPMRRPPPPPGFRSR